MATQLVSQQDALLTQASSGYFPEGYVSESVFPTIDVVQTTGLLGKYGQNHLRIVNTVVGGKAKYRRVETQVRTTTQYVIEGHGLEGLVTQEDYRNVLKPFDAEKDEVLGIANILWLEKEKGMADTLSNTSVITQYDELTGASEKWSNYEESDPLDDINTGKLAVRDGCGGIANVGICEYKVAEKLRYHPQLLDFLGFKFDRPGGLSYQELAMALGLDRIYVPNVMYNSANSGQSTTTLTAVWSDNFILASIPKTAAPRQISLGYLVRYAGQSPRKVYKWSENNPPNSTAVLVEDHYDLLISNAAAGYLIKDVLA